VAVLIFRKNIVYANTISFLVSLTGVRHLYCGNWAKKREADWLLFFVEKFGIGRSAADLVRVAVEGIELFGNLLFQHKTEIRMIGHIGIRIFRFLRLGRFVCGFGCIG